MRLVWKGMKSALDCDQFAAKNLIHFVLLRLGGLDFSVIAQLSPVFVSVPINGKGSFSVNFPEPRAVLPEDLTATWVDHCNMGGSKPAVLHGDEVCRLPRRAYRPLYIRNFKRFGQYPAFFPALGVVPVEGLPFAFEPPRTTGRVNHRLAVIENPCLVAEGSNSLFFAVDGGIHRPPIVRRNAHLRCHLGQGRLQQDREREQYDSALHSYATLLEVIGKSPIPASARMECRCSIMGLPGHCSCPHAFTPME